MPETYNPRENTFIKAPETKICVACGQPIQAEVQPMKNHMSKYINDTTGNVIVLNDNAEYVTVQGIKLRREDVKKTEVKSEVKTPTSNPTAPTPTKTP